MLIRPPSADADDSEVAESLWGHDPAAFAPAILAVLGVSAAAVSV